MSSLAITRSRNGWPGHEASMIPEPSRTTAWKMRRPFRVGMIPLEMTFPTMVASIPGSREAIELTVLASS